MSEPATPPNANQTDAAPETYRLDPTMLLTNLTGHPAVVVPNGFGEKGLPTTITFTGRLYDAATILAVAKAYQTVTDFHQQYPPAFLP
jgi:Asp-tRNA(Asn)/Glu-tRNA(Gln) amidotransferase A subunit family amidase